ncbi:hypothetical protein BKA65DRAFT_559825 [Rhexocercosporidium sp. MPI-PUGE-AT-0058]|nr:hypothetical protein BKA65DRAFT_559825 [Rhexocercosporidium sp. MPI-PUGE-AT-0058]
MADNIWTPEIIATIVYRVIMILVSLAFIWREYRHVRPQLDEEQLISILVQRQSFSPAVALTSGRQDDVVNTHPTPRLRDHFRTNSNNIVASALGLDLGGTPRDVTTTAPLRTSTASYPHTISSSGLVHAPGQPDITGVLPLRQFCQTAARPRPVSNSIPDHGGGNGTADIHMRPIQHHQRSLSNTLTAYAPERSATAKSERNDE